MCTHTFTSNCTQPGGFAVGVFFNSLARKGGWEFVAAKAHFLPLPGGGVFKPTAPPSLHRPLPGKILWARGRGFSAPLLKVVCLRAKSSLARGLRASKQIFLSNIWGGQRGRSPAPLVTLRLNALKKEKPTHKKSLRQGTELKIAPYSPDDRQQNGY